ncbi:MAG: rhodanese-like domain-containing protein [Acidobacteria bacterium]|nr:rhodanese-like domain-containing protein [Acidobacteriota bacterium]
MKINSFTGRVAIVAVGGLFLLGCDKMMSSHEQPGSSQTTANSSSAGSIVPPAVPETQNPEDKMPRIGPEESQKLVKDGKAVIIDVRGTDAYNMAHIKGALDIPLNNIEAGDYNGLPKGKRIIAYCT